MKTTHNVTIGILLANLFIAFIGIGLVIPVMPTLMNELHISGTVVGYMTAAFALTQLVVSPFSGKAADKFGRKIMIVIGLFIFSLSELLFAVGTSVELLFVSRIFGGMSAAFIMPAVTAFIVDSTTLKGRAKALGYMSAAIGTGFIIGPGIGGFLAEYGTRAPFFAAATMALIAAVISLVFLREPERQNLETADSKAAAKGGLRKIVLPIFLMAFIVIFVSSFGMALFESFFSLYTDHKFGFTPRDIAIAITGGAIIGVVCQIVVFDKLVRAIGEVNLVRMMLILSGLLTFAVTITHSYWLIMAVVFLLFTGFDLIRPAVTNYLSRIAGNDQGFVGGMNSFFTSLANVFGPVLGGIFFDINIDYPFYVATIVIVLGTILAFFWKDPTRHQTAD
ncbi:MFS transporter [Brochothrix campestris]|uniref:MFS transporter n=1 Tax=Brochothrix campestris TaxID=2757 RepID=UPI0038CFEA56